MSNATDIEAHPLLRAQNQNRALRKGWGTLGMVRERKTRTKDGPPALLKLNITPEQEKTLQQHLDANNPNAPGAAPYSINNGNSCVDQVEKPLLETGILSPESQYRGQNPTESLPTSSVTPGELQLRLEDQPGLVQSTQTVGESKTGFLKSLWGTIKHAVGGGQ